MAKKAKAEGDDLSQASDRLAAVVRAVYDEAENKRPVLKAIGVGVQRTMRDLMKNSPRSGNVYSRGVTVSHKASGPGEPPAPDTSNLRRSVMYGVGDDYVDVGANAEYAPYLEFGTRHMSARPFLRPAIDQSVDAISKEFQKHFEREAAKAAKKAEAAKTPKGKK